MGQSMVGRLAIKAKQVQPGDAFAAVVPAGGLVEIIDLEGKQVAELVAFDHADPSEHLSLGVTRHQSKSIMLSLGMKLYSSRGRTMLDLVEDTVGRHDLLWAAPTGAVEGAMPEAVDDDSPPLPETDQADTSGAETGTEDAGAPVAAQVTGDASTGPNPLVVTDTDTDSDTDSAPEPGQPDFVASDDSPSREARDDLAPEKRADPLTGFPAALAPFGLSDIDAPDPVNFFMQLAVMQRGDLELRPPLSERGDRVVLLALTELIVAVRCSAAEDETNGEKPTNILVRVYR